jgi:hypothetical protein
MARQEPQHDDDAVVAAINRVLRTERDGVEALRRAEKDARRRQSEARAQATAIARRADTCITRLHAAYMQKIEREVEALKAASSPADAEQSCDRAALAEAARRVAAKLTGDT